MIAPICSVCARDARPDRAAFRLPIAEHLTGFADFDTRHGLPGQSAGAGGSCIDHLEAARALSGIPSGPAPGEITGSAEPPTGNKSAGWMRSPGLIPPMAGDGRRRRQQASMGPPASHVEGPAVGNDRGSPGAHRHRSVPCRIALAIGAAAAILALSACGGGGSHSSLNTTPSTPVPVPTPTGTSPAPGHNCATTSGVTECVSDPVYFSASDPVDGTLYFAKLTYSIDNQSGQTISDVGGGMSVIDSSNATIGDIGGGGVTGIPPDVSNACFDSLDANLSLVNGQRLTLPKPLCFEMAGAQDRVSSVLDTGSNATISIGGG